MIKEGDKAPNFSLESDAGKRVSLSDFAGKTLVLYFYPKDDTPGCTRQAQAFTAARWAIDKAGGAVVGVSKDTVASHCKFKDKYDLQFPLLSDPDLKVHKAYGAYGEKSMYGKKVLGTIRTTFLIKNGKVTRVFPSVKVDGHADAILAALGVASGGSSETLRPAAPKAGKAAKAVAKAALAIAKPVKAIAKALTSKAKPAKAKAAKKASAPKKAPAPAKKAAPKAAAPKKKAKKK